MSISVTLDIKQIEKVVGALAMSGNQQKILQAVGAGAEQRVLERLHDSKKHFAPNSQRTIAEKAGDDPLRDTGVLMNSIAYQVEGNQVSIGTNLEYAEQVHDGDVTAHIPARPFLAQDAEMNTIIDEIITDNLEEIMRP